jgi:hypothetical protein
VSGWAPLWSGIVDSSIWDEDDQTVKVFLTMLALKDSDHVYRGDAYKLSRQSRKTEVEVLEALKVLASPDSRKISQQPFEGRRIRAVEDGWLILNGEKYKTLVRKEMQRMRNARAQANWRAKQKAKNNGRVTVADFQAAYDAAPGPEAEAQPPTST